MIPRRLRYFINTRPDLAGYPSKLLAREIGRFIKGKTAGKVTVGGIAGRIDVSMNGTLGRRIFREFMQNNGMANLLDEGRITWRRCGFIRADREALTGFLPIIDTSVLTAHAYESPEGKALFAVEGRVVKLSEFP